jgi:hypothetical protein
MIGFVNYTNIHKSEENSSPTTLRKADVLIRNAPIDHSQTSVSLLAIHFPLF